ncbi:hypothetical protein NDU88_005412 [Pleurodeles waltl]|uniref:Uncharacterized protein n=1 Tax=Pleurodeles waltl TaxID=8319 RepID=A0AAV7RJ02_PLEWA|nr:hypothetical protein NDU88_005412 [Pleurodeles waltl]
MSSPGARQGRGTPDVFPRGTGWRTISREAGDFWGHNLKRLTSPEEGAKENPERSNEDTYQIGKPEEDTTATTTRGEDAGPGFQEPRKRTSEKERGREVPESEARPERHPDLLNTEQPSPVPGGTWLHKEYLLWL